ncbi:hypothetical protein [Laspinema olomoucense]|uniref:SGNH/GDSL hydrolase family protein n=1 Tax=Laspinema olomoucense D3b TaxID=2953688 RepID=A0ABT2N6R5_9CYAN|nr:hypothetical protein [Laspinema sp. D3b]MCT7978385.1 hypothetical protein [Laspinema sp. D3b]
MNPYPLSSGRKPFSFKHSIRPLVRPLLVFLFLMTCYHTFMVNGVVPSSEGLNIQQSNIIKVENYVYNNLPYEIILTGSSRTAKIEADYFGQAQVANIGIRGGASQTGLELVNRNHNKPPIMLVEVNGTIAQGVNQELVEAAYHPLFYGIRRYLPMFKQEYQPVAVAIEILKNWQGISAEKLEQQRVNELLKNPQMRENTLRPAIEERREKFTVKQINKLTEESQILKNKIAEIENQGVRVILFDVPGDQLIDQTPQRLEEKKLMKQLFPAENYEWLPEHPPKEWITTDGIHLARSEAREYASFIMNYLGDF